MMFGQPKRLRRLAAQILLGWLFALAAGIVNACVVDVPRQPAPAAPHEHRHEHAGPAAHGHDTAAGHHHSPGLAKAHCAKFCGDEGSTVPAVKQSFDPGAVAWMAAAPTPGLVFAAGVDATPLHRADATAPPGRVPIPIAFLRLTL